METIVIYKCSVCGLESGVAADIERCELAHQQVANLTITGCLSPIGLGIPARLVVLVTLPDGTQEHHSYQLQS